MNFRDYLILGDDVVIANEDVAREYCNIIIDLGVEISITKSITPCGAHQSLEFASKLLCDGQDLSPFPVGTIIEAKSDLLSLLTL